SARRVSAATSTAPSAAGPAWTWPRASSRWRPARSAWSAFSPDEPPDPLPVPAQLYRSWAGTVGCEDEDCEHVRPQRPSEEIVRNYFHVPDLGCGHPHYVG